MTAAERPRLLKHLWISTLLSGILSVILGVLVLRLPETAIFTAAILLGAYLLVSGIAQVFFGFTLDVSAGGRIWLFISGAASVILAVLAFSNVGKALTILVIWIGVGFIFRGVSTLMTAVGDPALPGRGWEIFFGLVSILAGVFVLGWPESLGALVLVIGIGLVVIGVMEIVTAFGIRRASKNLEALAEQRITAEG